MGAFTNICFTKKTERSKLIEYCLDNSINVYFFKLTKNSRFCEFVLEDMYDGAKSISKTGIPINLLTMLDGDTINFTTFYDGKVKFFLSTDYDSEYNEDWQREEILDLEVFKKMCPLSYMHILDGMKKEFEEAFFSIVEKIGLQYYETDLLLTNIDQYKGSYSHLKA